MIKIIFLYPLILCISASAAESPRLKISEYRRDGKINVAVLSGSSIGFNAKVLKLDFNQIHSLEKKISSDDYLLKASSDEACLPTDRWELDYRGSTRRFCSNQRVIGPLRTLSADIKVMVGF